jgi:hypothetical protein
MTPKQYNNRVGRLLRHVYLETAKIIRAQSHELEEDPDWGKCHGDPEIGDYDDLLRELRRVAADYDYLM